MKIGMVLCALLATVVVTPLSAQDFAGDWQGTLAANLQNLRLVLRIAKGDGGGWNASVFNANRGSHPIPVTALRLKLRRAGLTAPEVSYLLQRHPSTASVKASLRKARDLDKGLEEVTPLTRSQVDGKRANRTSGRSKSGRVLLQVLSVPASRTIPNRAWGAPASSMARSTPCSRFRGTAYDQQAVGHTKLE
jgi:hypothetical protein